MINVNKVLEVNVNDFANDLNVFYKSGKINGNLGRIETIRNKRYSKKRTVSKCKNTFAISLEKYIFICSQQNGTWRLFKYNCAHRIDKCICIDNSNLLLLQKGSQIYIEEFEKVYGNKPINDIKLLRRHDISANAIFFCVCNGYIYVIDKNGRLWEVDMRQSFSPCPSINEVNNFDLKKNNEIYFKVENENVLIIAYYDESEKNIRMLIYDLEEKEKKEEIILPYCTNMDESKKTIECITMNKHYIVLLYSTNELIIYENNVEKKKREYKIYKYLDSQKCSQLKYFNNKNLDEIKNYSLEDKILTLTNNFKRINKSISCQEEKRKEIISLYKHLNIHEINKNKIKLFYNNILNNDILLEKSFLNIDFLKDITKNKKSLYDQHTCSNIYLCCTDDYYLILENIHNDFNLILYEMRFLNKQESLLYEFFHNYYDALLSSERHNLTAFHQLFAYAIYDHGGRYFDAPLTDYQCLFKIRNIFDFLDRAIAYDPFLFREEEEESIAELLRLKKSTSSGGDYICTNMNVKEENNNYDNFFYILNNTGGKHVCPSKYVNSYYTIKKVHIDSIKSVDVNVQLRKLKNVLYCALKGVNHLLQRVEEISEEFTSSGESEQDEEAFMISLMKNKRRKSGRGKIQSRHRGISAFRVGPTRGDSSGNDIDSGDELTSDDDAAVVDCKSDHGSDHDSDHDSDINKIWEVSIDQADLQQDDSSSSATEERSKGEKKEGSKIKHIYDIDCDAFCDGVCNIEGDESLREKLVGYKKEIENQIYKYKLYEYVMKLLYMERRNGTQYAGDPERVSSSIDNICVSGYDSGRAGEAVGRGNSKNKISDLFSIFKKGTNDPANAREEGDDVNEDGSSRGHMEGNQERDKTDVYIMSWTKFKYYYSPFDIVKYFLINKNYILIKTFYKYFNHFVNYNWQKIMDFISLSAKMEDFFFLLPTVETHTASYISSALSGNNREMYIYKNSSINGNITIDNHAVGDPVVEQRENINQGVTNCIKTSQKNDKNDISNEEICMNRHMYSVRGKKDSLCANEYDIVCDEHAFLNFFINRSINIIKRTHLIKSRLLPFVYVCLKKMNGDNIYEMFTYDKFSRRYTFDECYFTQLDCSSTKAKRREKMGKPTMGNDNNPNECISKEEITLLNEPLNRKVDVNDIDLNRREEKKGGYYPNFNDPNFVKNNLHINLKKSKIENENVMLIYSFFVLIKMYILCKENNKSVKFHQFLHMDIYTRMCLTIDFDIKYLSYENYNDNNIKLFYDRLKDILINYEVINEYILLTSHKNYYIFEKDIINLYYKKASNILQCLYINMFYSSQQLYIIFCLKTMKILQFTNLRICKKGQKNDILEMSSCILLNEKKKQGNSDREEIKKHFDKDGKNGGLDKLFLFLKYIYYAYKNRLIFNDDYEFSFFFLLLFYKYIHVNLLHFISIFNDFYNLLPKKVCIKNEINPDNGKRQLRDNRRRRGSTECFYLRDIFKESEEEDDRKVIIYDEHLNRIVHYYYETVGEVGGTEKTLESFTETDEQNEEGDPRNLRERSPSHRNMNPCRMMERCLDKFEKHLNSLELIKHFRKDLCEVKEEMKISIEIKVKNITIYDSFDHLYKFMTRICKEDKCIKEFQKIKGIIANLRLLLYVQKIVNRKRSLLLTGDHTNEQHKCDSKYVTKNNIKYNSPNEDVYKSFSKLIAQSCEKINNVEHFEVEDGKKNKMDESFLSRHLHFDTYIKIEMERNSFFIFRNIIENDFSQCSNYRRIIKLLKMLHTKKDHLKDCLLYVMHILQIEEKAEILSFYLTLFLIIFQNEQLTKKERTFLEGIIIHYSEHSEQSTNRVYNFSMFIFSYLSLSYSLRLHFLYKTILRRKLFFQKRHGPAKCNHDGNVKGITGKHCSYDNFTSVQELLEGTSPNEGNVEEPYWGYASGESLAKEVPSQVHLNVSITRTCREEEGNKSSKMEIGRSKQGGENRFKEDSNAMYNLEEENKIADVFNKLVAKRKEEPAHYVSRDELCKRGQPSHLKNKTEAHNANNELSDGILFKNIFTLHKDEDARIDEHENGAPIEMPQRLEGEGEDQTRIERVSHPDSSHDSRFVKDDLYANEHIFGQDAVWDETCLDEDNCFGEYNFLHRDIDEGDMQPNRTEEVGGGGLEVEESDLEVEESDLEVEESDLEMEESDFDVGESNLEMGDGDKKCFHLGLHGVEEISTHDNRQAGKTYNWLEEKTGEEERHEGKQSGRNMQHLRESSENRGDYSECSNKLEVIKNGKKHFVREKDRPVFLTGSGKGKNALNVNKFTIELKNAYKTINRHNVTKWNIREVILTVRKIKRIIEKGELNGRGVNDGGGDHDYNLHLNRHLHYFSHWSEDERVYRRIGKNTMYSALMRSDLYFACQYILSVEDYSFVLIFLRRIIENETVLIRRKLDIFDALLFSVCDYHRCEATMRSKEHPFLRKTVLVLIILRYLLFHMHENGMRYTDMKKLLFEDSYKKNIAKNVNKKSREEILETLIKITDISKIHLQHVSYKMVRKNGSITFTLEEDTEGMATSNRVTQNRVTPSAATSNGATSNEATSEEATSNEVDSGQGKQKDMSCLHPSTTLSKDAKRKKEKRMHYLFEIEAEKNLLYEFQKDEKNSLLCFVLKNIRHLRFNINFVRMMLYCIYEVCLYFLCPSIFFVIASCYNFNMGSFFSPISKIVKNFKKDTLEEKLIELRLIFVYLKDDEDVTESVVEDGNSNRNMGSSFQRCKSSIEEDKDDFGVTFPLPFKSVYSNNFNLHIKGIEDADVSFRQEVDILSVKESNNVENYNLGKGNVYDYFVFLIRKLKIPPYLYDLNALLKTLDINFHNFFLLSEEGYVEKRDELLDAADSDYLLYTVCAMGGEDWLQMVENAKKDEMNGTYETSEIILKGICRFFYAGGGYQSAVLDFIAYHSLFKVSGPLWEEATRLFNDLLHVQFEDVQRDAEIHFSKWVFLRKKSIQRILHLYNDKDKISINHSNSFYKLVTDNVQKIEVLLLLLLTQNRSKSMLKYILLKILILLFFLIVKDSKFCFSDFLCFITSSLKGENAPLLRYDFLDIVFRNRENGDDTVEKESVRGESVVSGESEKGLSDPHGKDDDVHSETDLYIDRRVDTQSTDDEQEREPQKPQQPQQQQSQTLQDRACVGGEVDLVTDINSLFMGKEMRLTLVNEDNRSDSSGGSSHGRGDGRIGRSRGGDGNGDVEKIRIGEIGKAQRESSRMDKEKSRTLARFCLNYVSIKNVVKSLIKREIRSILFLNFSYNTSVVNLVENAKYIYNYFCDLRGNNVFYSLKVLIIMLLRSKQRKDKFRSMYFFFVLLHIVYYVKRTERTSMGSHEKGNIQEKQYTDIGNCDSIDREVRGGKTDHNEVSGNHVMEVDHICNLDEAIMEKENLLKSLLVLLLINLSNAFLPAVSRLYTIREEKYLYVDAKKDVKLKCDVCTFVLMLLQYIHVTYVQGYEFVYLSMLLLTEYSIDLFAGKYATNAIYLSHIIIYKKMQGLINAYKEYQTNLHGDDKHDCIHFVNSQTYINVRSKLSQIFLKMLSRCDRSIILACKIMIGNRLNAQDEMNLFKMVRSELLFFFTFNYAVVKSNKQNVLSQSTHSKGGLSQGGLPPSGMGKTGRTGNDLFQPKIVSFVKVLLVILTYNVDSFREWEYFQTIKQIVMDTEWYRIYDANYMKEMREINFLSKKCTMNNREEDNSGEDCNTCGGESLDTSSTDDTTKEMKETLKLYFLQRGKQKRDHRNRIDVGSIEGIHYENSLHIPNLMSSNESIPMKNEVDNTITGEMNHLHNAGIVEVVGKDLLMRGDHESAASKKGTLEERTTSLEPVEEEKLEVNPVKRPVERPVENIAGKDAQNAAGDDAGKDAGNAAEDPAWEEAFHFNTSASRETILNVYGKGFLSGYVKKHMKNKQCEKQFHKINRKSKMFNILKYCSYILKYWDVKVEYSGKSEEEEGFQILIFFANYFNFFKHYIKYRVILKLYLRNRLSEADELLTSKSRMWKWYRTDVKMKYAIEEFLTKEISCNNFFFNQGNDPFLRYLNRWVDRDYRKENCFYLRNLHNNKSNRTFLSSLRVQYYTYCRMQNGIHMGEDNDQQEVQQEVPQEVQQKVQHDSAEDGKKKRGTNTCVHHHEEGEYTTREGGANTDYLPMGRNSRDNEQFPLCFLTILDVYKRTIDVYDFYYQLIIHKLMKEEDFNVSKIQLYWEDLQKYLKNKLNNYDLYLMLFYYQYFTFQAIRGSHKNINFLRENEQKFVIYAWTKLTHAAVKKYRCANVGDGAV
ncbi:conserved Plasmodium protein, unknown function [Plasmodium ovale wallikeri]|uniref:Uncharacterized protein n=1 Tax=Plasmodium ovale wallikeri TaxID=864142 RepID=A0A1A8YIN4_PLAOA|nr:conserved Plasmodium protein, unknown function [Plasmodium ovale wallikeri]